MSENDYDRFQWLKLGIERPCRISIILHPTLYTYVWQAAVNIDIITNYGGKAEQLTMDLGWEDVKTPQSIPLQAQHASHQFSSSSLPPNSSATNIIAHFCGSSLAVWTVQVK